MGCNCVLKDIKTTKIILVKKIKPIV